MTDIEIRDKLFAINKELNEISDAIALGIDYDDGLDSQYLKSKVKAVLNTANHIHKYQL